MRPAEARYYRELRRFLKEMVDAGNVLARNQARLGKLLNEVADGHGLAPVELEQFKKEKEQIWKKHLEQTMRRRHHEAT